MWLRTVERDQDESLQLAKPQILIDDKEAAAQKKAKENENIRKSQTPVTSDVVYEAEGGEDVQKAAPLIDDKKQAARRANAAKTPTYVAPPPPPSAPSYSSPSASSSSGTTDNSVPALF